MTARTLIETYDALRRAPMWKLIAADRAPVTIGVLQTLLFDNERTLAASLFIDRAAAILSEAEEEIVTREAAAARANQWIREGWIVCRLPQGASEEFYELTSAGLDAVRFLSRYPKRRRGPSETRLDMVTHAIVRLADETLSNPEERIARLTAERDRIDAEIEAVRTGRREPLGDAAALARAADILDLYSELQTDFRRVREEFDRLNFTFRSEFMRSEGPKTERLDRFFAGWDGIRESEAGKAFEGFYRLLTDPVASEELQDAIDGIRSRAFFSELPAADRDALTGLQTDLLERARETRAVMLSLARSLREFVERREYVEEQRLGALLLEARRAALAACEARPPRGCVFEMRTTSADVSSISELEPDDPSTSGALLDVVRAETPEIDALAVAERIREADIDWQALKRAVRMALARPDADEVSVGEVFAQPGVRPGLASLIGLLTLAARYGESVRVGDATLAPLEPAESAENAPANGAPLSDAAVPAGATPFEHVAWTDRTGEVRSARVPLHRFTAASLEAMRRSRSIRATAPS